MSQITIASIHAAAALAGLTVINQSKFLKIANVKKAVYVGKNKGLTVTRIDISGFKVDHPAVMPLTKRNGCVTGQINCNHDDALSALHVAFEALRDGFTGTKLEVYGDVKAPCATKSLAASAVLADYLADIK